MVTYKSRYAELAFYVGGRERKFSGGVYVAETPEEIAVLERLVDAVPDAIPETTPEVNAEPAPESTPEIAEQPAAPAKAVRKPAKASAK